MGRGLRGLWGGPRVSGWLVSSPDGRSGSRGEGRTVCGVHESSGFTGLSKVPFVRGCSCGRFLCTLCLVKVGGGTFMGVSLEVVYPSRFLVESLLRGCWPSSLRGFFSTRGRILFEAAALPLRGRGSCVSSARPGRIPRSMSRSFYCRWCQKVVRPQSST